MKTVGAELILQRNFDCLDEDVAEEDFPESETLIYLSGEGRAEEIAELLHLVVPEAKLLRRLGY
ncbi:MAG: hypothetical protein MPN21_28395 [Thermoanaerobaculia bacterium]|nr:hypothetical protein [Thermoanaerobaculia bacterium]